MLVAAILEAATRVLARDGAHRFTTARVAEQAGVSIGSLYQYFPNKEAILFRLQAEEWNRTGDMLQSILGDTSRSPFERIESVVHAFFLSELDEVDLRGVLGDAAPLYRDAPETHQQRKAGLALLSRFMKEALPDATARQRSMAANLILTAMAAIGQQISDERRSQTEVRALARETSAMFGAYLATMR